MSETPITQIISFAFQHEPVGGLQDDNGWARILDLCEWGSGVQRIYWGRSHEHPEHAQLHIASSAAWLTGTAEQQLRQFSSLLVRMTFDQHRQFLGSSSFRELLSALEQLTGSPRRPVIRHAQLQSWSADDQSLAREAPFSGTAIYYNTTAGWEHAWPLWTHIVRHVDGCLGGSGGPLLEPVDIIPGPMKATVNREKEPLRSERANIVFVGWQTKKQHDDFHHTSHFAERFVILNCANEGFAEYGHIVFEGSREKVGSGREAKL